MKKSDKIVNFFKQKYFLEEKINFLLILFKNNPQQNQAKKNVKEKTEVKKTITCPRGKLMSTSVMQEKQYVLEENKHVVQQNATRVCVSLKKKC